MFCSYQILTLFLTYPQNLVVGVCGIYMLSIFNIGICVLGMLVDTVFGINYVGFVYGTGRGGGGGTGRG